MRKGRYIVRERGATAGYVMEEIALDATVRSDETTQLRATNQPVMVKLKLYKRDGDEYGGDDPNSRRRDELPQPANIDAPSTRGDGELTGAVFRVLAGAEIRDRQEPKVHPEIQVKMVTMVKTVRLEPPELPEAAAITAVPLQADQQ